MPSKGTALSKECESSSIFQPAMFASRGADVRHFEPIDAQADWAIAARPGRHFGYDE